MRNETINQIQALHDLIRSNYGAEHWLVVPDTKGQDYAAMAKLQIHLGQIFPHNKAGRELRLDTLVAILPIMNHDKTPIELDSTNKLLLAELYALLSWLEQNGAAKKALQEVSKNPMGNSIELRGLLGYVYRPFIGGLYAPEEQEEPTLFGWPQDAETHQER